MFRRISEGAEWGVLSRWRDCLAMERSGVGFCGIWFIGAFSVFCFFIRGWGKLGGEGVGNWMDGWVH